MADEEDDDDHLAILKDAIARRMFGKGYHLLSQMQKDEVRAEAARISPQESDHHEEYKDPHNEYVKGGKPRIDGD